MAYIEKNLFSVDSVLAKFVSLCINVNVWIRSVPIFTFHLYFFIYTKLLSVQQVAKAFWVNIKLWAWVFILDLKTVPWTQSKFYLALNWSL